MNGKVFNIMKYSVHDGPGIRTTVFLKGCPLSCLWCHNPESQNISDQLMLFPNRCIGCKECIKSCNESAIKLLEGRIITDLHKCTNCGECTLVCFAEAREISGKTMTTDEVVEEVLKDRDFYNESGGGVTFSGGEPLQQSTFLLSVLNEIKKLNIHTTLDTSGYASSKVIEEVAMFIDLFLYDLKHINAEKHEKYTGVSNKIIIENLKKLNDMDKEIVVRIPFIPGFNDSLEDLIELRDYISSLSNIREVNLLPYHNIGLEKYNRLGKEYMMKDLLEPSQEYMEYAAEIMGESGLKVKIGG